MISEALSRTVLLELEVTGWDYVAVPMANGILIGVAVAVRGYALSGPGRELMQFRPFSSWQPSQAEVDTAVTAIIEGLRIARAEQLRQLNGGKLADQVLILRISNAGTPENLIMTDVVLSCLRSRMSSRAKSTLISAPSYVT